MKKSIIFTLLLGVIFQMQAVDQYTLYGINFDKSRMVRELQEYGIVQNKIDAYFNYVDQILASKSSDFNSSDFDFVIKFPISSRQKFSLKTRVSLGYVFTFNQLLLMANNSLFKREATMFLHSIKRDFSDAVWFCPQDKEGQEIFMKLISLFNSNEISDGSHYADWSGTSISGAISFNGGIMQIAKNASNALDPLLVNNNSIIVNKTNHALKVVSQEPGKVAMEIGYPLSKESLASKFKSSAYLRLGKLQGSSTVRVGISISKFYNKVIIDNTEISEVSAGMYIQKDAEVILRNVIINTNESLSARDLQSLNSSTKVNEKFATNIPLASVSNIYNGIYFEEGAIVKTQNVIVNGNKLPDTL